MASFGPGPLQNDESIDEFGAILHLISGRIDVEISRLAALKGVESGVMGGVSALRALCDLDPRIANMVLDSGRVAQWRDTYVAWVKGRIGRFPKRQGGEVLARAEAEFERILEHCS